MNELRDDRRRWCYFHPKELVVGVCALCLNERLLLLASNQTNAVYTVKPKRALPNIFALTNLFSRFDTVKQHKSQVYYSSSSSPEDSFISIKFEDNGVASWDKGKISRISHDHQCNENWDKNKKIKSVVEHAKQPAAALRWRKRIGHLFQVIRWKRSSKGGSMCLVGTKVEASKVKYGWIRTLTKRRTKE